MYWGHLQAAQPPGRGICFQAVRACTRRYTFAHYHAGLLNDILWYGWDIQERENCERGAPPLVTAIRHHEIRFGSNVANRS